MKEGKVASRARRKIFLALLELGLSVSGATRAARLHRSAPYKLRQRDPEFAADWNAALAAGKDALEDEALRRGVFGVERPVFYAGKQVGSITHYSDKMLTLLLRLRRPEKFAPPRQQDDTVGLAARLEAARKRIQEPDPKGVSKT